MSRNTHLKIKIKTLAAEARIIRKEERKALEAGRLALKRVADGRGATPSSWYSTYAGLHEHRRGIVRSTARLNNIAYGFLRGHAYSEIEQKTLTQVDLSAVWKLVKRFGGREDLARWSEWQGAATAYLDAQDCPAVKLPDQSEYARYTKEVA